MKKNKKAFTLIEMIVSLALIAIVSIMLVGILVPAARLQSAAEQRNTGLNSAAAALDKDTPAGSTSSISINLGGVSCGGTLYTSKDTKSDVTLYAFVPDP